VKPDKAPTVTLLIPSRLVPVMVKVLGPRVEFVYTLPKSVREVAKSDLGILLNTLLLNKASSNARIVKVIFMNGVVYGLREKRILRFINIFYNL
jgi:hypothetical protein